MIELDVKVGDTVKPGQLLGREDPFSFAQALNQANAALSQQQAMLTEDIRDVTVPGDHAPTDQAVQTLYTTRSNAAAQDAANRTTIERDRTALDFAEVQLRVAKRQEKQGSRGGPLAGAIPGG